MAMTVLETLTALFNDTIEGLARLGCGMVGVPYPTIEDDNENT